MTKGFLIALAMVGCPTVWILLLMPLIARGFGVPYKVGILPFDRRNESLSKWQSFWFAGVLGWGICVFLVGVLIHSFGEFSNKPTNPQLILILALSCLSGGALSLWNYSRHQV